MGHPNPGVSVSWKLDAKEEKNQRSALSECSNGGFARWPEKKERRGCDRRGSSDRRRARPGEGRSEGATHDDVTRRAAITQTQKGEGSTCHQRLHPDIRKNSLGVHAQVKTWIYLSWGNATPTKEKRAGFTVRPRGEKKEQMLSQSGMRSRFQRL